MAFRRKFAQDLRSRKVVAGTFIKSNDPAVVEILGHSGFDFAILDAEHAALDRADIARMAMAARAAELPLIVRIPDATGTWIATVLDAGCAGVMVPQVANADAARELVRMMRYGAGGMGFSPSTPGAEYGARGVTGHLAKQPEETVLLCQIEDRDAVENAGEIAQVDGVDGLLLGPVDLAVAVGSNDPASPEVTALCQHVITASRGEQIAVGLFLSDTSQGGSWLANGANIFVLGSDQAFLMTAAKTATKTFHNSTGA